MQHTPINQVRPRKDRRGVDLISDTLHSVDSFLGCTALHHEKRLTKLYSQPPYLRSTFTKSARARVNAASI
jgi:hypothetical protein